MVRNLQNRIRERAVGLEVSAALTSAQQVIKIVNEELTATLGGETMRITFASKPPTVVLMAGLQGSGKTTNSAKLARWFKAQGRNPLLVGADLQRPAAVEQLRVLGASIDVPVYSEPTDPVAVAQGAVAEARRLGRDVVIVDTAGRLAIDEEMMAQVRDISAAVDPDYTFLVIDAMLGQDAVTVAEGFHNSLALDGVILTKLDGDARGGAALSVKEVVGRPIAFASTGEKLEDFDLFHPDRLAGRILGMGDMLSLIEKAEEAFDAEQSEVAAQRLMDGTFTFDDFLEQMNAIRKMGPLSNIIGMLPGIPKEVRVRSATRKSARSRRSSVDDDRGRTNPDIIDTSRRQRIARGHEPHRRQLITQFKEMRKMMQQMGGGAMARQEEDQEGSEEGLEGQPERPHDSSTLPIPKKEFRLPGLDPLVDQLEGRIRSGLDLGDRTTNITRRRPRAVQLSDRDEQPYREKKWPSDSA